MFATLRFFFNKCNLRKEQLIPPKKQGSVVLTLQMRKQQQRMKAICEGYRIN